MRRLSCIGFVIAASLNLFVAARGGDDDASYGDISAVQLAKPEDKVDAATVPAPSGATVLFDGTNLDAWRSTNGKSPAPWKLVEGRAVQVQKGSIMTRRKFDGHFKLHVEFRVPYMPMATGQGRGNSGVYLQGRYEVQILDSYGRQSKDDDCGGIYKVAIPRVNACKAPTVWQSYEIDFRAPVFADGKRVNEAQISVLHNGLRIHDKVSIPLDNTVAGLGGDPSKPGPIMLQDHGNPVQYRNIWLLPLSE